VNDTNTIDAPTIISDVERFLHVQYVMRQRKQTQTVQTWPMDGIVIIAAWLLITYIVIGGK
jgi:uncharacterized membrane protein YidH (DUF202 family)